MVNQSNHEDDEDNKEGDGGKRGKAEQEEKQMQQSFWHFASEGETTKALELLENGVNPNFAFGEVGRTILHCFILNCNPDQHGHSRPVEELLRGGVNLNQQDHNGWSALHYAVVKNSLPLVKILLAYDIDHRLKTTERCVSEGREFPDGVTAQVFAEQLGFDEIGFNLHRHAKIAPPARPVIQPSNLTWSILCGNLEKTREFLQLRDKINSPDLDYQGCPFIVFAAKNMDKSLVSLLLEFGANPNAFEEKTKKTALHFVCQFGDHLFAELLVKTGAQVTATDKWGQTALHYAVRARSPCTFALVRFLIQQGLSFNLKDEDNCPAFFGIAKQPHMTTAQRILLLALQEGIDHRYTDDDGNTFLHQLIAAGREEMALSVLQGATATKLDLTIRNKDHKSIIMLAEEKKCTNVMHLARLRLAQQSGSGASRADCFHVTDLFLAAAKVNDTPRMLELLQLEPNFSKEDKEKMTAMHWVIWHHNREILKQYLERGFSPDLANSQSCTLLMLAVSLPEVSLAVIELLVKYEVNCLQYDTTAFTIQQLRIDPAPPIATACNRELWEVVQLLQPRAKALALEIAEDSDFTEDLAALYGDLRSGHYEAVMSRAREMRDTADISRCDRNHWPLALYLSHYNDVKWIRAFARNPQIKAENQTMSSNLLDVACRRNHREMCLMLIEELHFDPLRVRPKDGSSIAEGAMGNGGCELAQYLFETYHLPLTHLNLHGDSILRNAVDSGALEFLEAVQTLLPASYWTARNNYEANLFHILASSTSTRRILETYQLIKRVIHDSKKVAELLNAGNSSGRTPLMLAAQNDFAVLLEAMIHDGGDPTARNSKVQNYEYWDVLMYAIAAESLTSVKVLLAAGINPQYFLKGKVTTDVKAQINDGISPLEQAVYKRNYEIVECLLEQMTDVDIRGSDDGGDCKGDTALIAACVVGDMRLMKLLVERGADINAMNTTDCHPGNGRTPLTAAINKRLPDGEAIAYLLSFPQIDPNQIPKDTRCCPAIHQAVFNGDVRAVELLVQHPQTNLNACGRGTDVSLPLIEAVQRANVEVVRVLVASERIHLEAVDDYGMTALDWAQTYQLPSIVSVIEEEEQRRRRRHCSTPSDPLAMILVANQVESFRRYLQSRKAEQDFDINALIGEEKLSLLHRVAQRGLVEYVKVLFEEEFVTEIDVNLAQPETWNTALHYAALNNYPAVIAQLITHPNLAVNAVVRFGYRFLHSWSGEICFSDANYHREEVGSGGKVLCGPKAPGETALSLAVGLGNAQCVAVLLTHPQIDPNRGRTCCGNDGVTPLL